jgi:hypothetical protein
MLPEKVQPEQGDTSLLRSNLRAIMEYQYQSICRGGHSIMETIRKAGYDPAEYSQSHPRRAK